MAKLNANRRYRNKKKAKKHTPQPDLLGRVDMGAQVIADLQNLLADKALAPTQQAALLLRHDAFQLAGLKMQFLTLGAIQEGVGYVASIAKSLASMDARVGER